MVRFSTVVRNEYKLHCSDEHESLDEVDTFPNSGTSEIVRSLTYSDPPKTHQEGR